MGSPGRRCQRHELGQCCIFIGLCGLELCQCCCDFRIKCIKQCEFRINERQHSHDAGEQCLIERIVCIDQRDQCSHLCHGCI